MNIDTDVYLEAPVVRVRMEVPGAAVDAILDATSVLSPAPGAYEDLLNGRSWIEAYGVDRAALEATAEAMIFAAKALGLGDAAVEYTVLPKEDWAESWKRFFHVIRISARVTVRPPWEEYTKERADEVVVAIEPGMSFGTGLHATTQACLRFLEQLAEEQGDALSRSVADFGCGSGILSIAARMLGFKDVMGLDYDAAAVRISAENAADNNVLDVPFKQCDVTCDLLPVRDIVVANILAPILIGSAGRIASAVSEKSSSYLILSGILTTQYPDVRDSYAAQGFEEVRSITIGEWTTGLFQRINA